MAKIIVNIRTESIGNSNILVHCVSAWRGAEQVLVPVGSKANTISNSASWTKSLGRTLRSEDYI
jgi:hypothetical protein